MLLKPLAGLVLLSYVRKVNCDKMSSAPTLYEYYTNGGVKTGLKTAVTKFDLNGKPFTIHSGTIHYFRVHPDYWRDRLRKLRAASLNCVETYFAWNLHEPRPGFYEFGQSGTDFEEFCDFQTFLTIAQEEDLFVIARPGPYICAEWEFGGLPSWLLKDPSMEVRTSDWKFVDRVGRYFGKLLGILRRFQFTSGGPVIAFQIENEYGNVKEADEPIDTNYLEILKEIYIENGIVELLFTSDTPSSGKYGSLPGVLYTANFQTDATAELDILKSYQPDKPCLVMEYWTGWFDHWGQEHQTRSNETFSNTLEEILKYPSSVNMYMFHGGTNWGFMNGGNFENERNDNSNIDLDTTSYDYDAPLAENGDYTTKYHSVKAIVDKYSEIKFKTPDMPALIPRISYADIDVNEELNLSDLAEKIDKITSPKTMFMEEFGQSYGYTLYRKTNLTISGDSVLKIKDHVRDTVMVLIDGKLISPVLENIDDLDKFGYWKLKDSTLNIPAISNATLDIVIENFGRVNYGKLYQFNQNKGLDEDQASLNDTPLRDWEIYPVQFERNWNNCLDNWRTITDYLGPKLYRALLNVTDKRDTYLDMRDWTKGIVIVNDFVLGRYFKFGPQKTLYLPAPLLNEGENKIMVFEHFKAFNKLRFCKDPIFES